MEADVSAGSVEDLAYGVDNASAIGPGLPQNLGKRSAFPTDTLKTHARFQQLPQAHYSLVFLQEEKNGGLVLMWRSRSWILTTLA
jgi:hypothetical protein